MKISVSAFLIALALSIPVYADEALSVTVTPPLIQLTIGRGESWTSALKVVNTNPYDVTYYAQPMDFTAQGEGGQGSLTPLMGDATGNTLATWVEISPEPVVVPRGTSKEIPFTVHIPADASPGGHYAAILVGTQPPEMNAEGALVSVSSYVSSLLFVRIEGEIAERGRIREFRTGRTLYQTSDVDFLVRFENQGNTHLLPRGTITLYNMWGKERGKLLVNESSNFGNVLPASIRKFEFSWKGEQGIFDIGRYSAVAALSYGENGKQSASATTYFWVVPIVPVASTLAAVIFFILLLTWLIRRYIRRALALERKRRGGEEMPPPRVLETFAEPLREGVVDLRRALQRGAPVPEAGVPPRLAPLQFLKAYRLFFLFLLVLMAGVAGIWLYFSDVLDSERSFEIRQISSEQEEAPIE
jgi:hypothetical protein